MIRSGSDADDGVLPFGAFLVANNIISMAELEASLICQADRHPRLGHLASQHNLLTYEKIREVYEYQLMHGTRFGETAIKLGLLTDDEVARLLEDQMSHHKMLGEILVELHILSRKNLDQYLTAYFAENARFPIEPEDCASDLEEPPPSLF